MPSRTREWHFLEKEKESMCVNHREVAAGSLYDCEKAVDMSGFDRSHHLPAVYPFPGDT